jgi:N utilization substance protein A
MMRAEILVNEGIKTVSEVAEMSSRTFVRLLNMNEAEAAAVVESANEMLAKGIGASKEKQTSASSDTDEFLANASADPTRQDAPATGSSYDTARNERINLFLELDGVGEATAHALADAGYGTIGDLVADAAEEVASRSGLSIGVARTVQMAADRYLQR